MTGIFKKIVQVLLKSNSKLNASDIFLGICMLLIGGIGFLKGYDLILEARVRNLADQAIKIQSSYYRFIDFYRHIPGDWMAEEAARIARIAEFEAAARRHVRLRPER